MNSSDNKLTSLATLSKIGSIVIHVEELLSPDGRELDRQVIEGLLRDPEVRDWIKTMGPLLPVKRHA